MGERYDIAAEGPARDFVERLGMTAQADGLPRIAGRLIALLILEGGPISFGHLAERLQVSRGSVSTNARLLEQFGVIERVSLPGERQDFFQITNQPYRRLVEGAMARLQRARGVVDDALRSVDGDPAAEARLRELHDFYQGALDGAQGQLTAMDLREPTRD